MTENPIDAWTRVRALLDRAACQAVLMETTPDPDVKDAATEAYAEACDQLVVTLSTLQGRGVLNLFDQLMNVTFGRAA